MTRAARDPRLCDRSGCTTMVQPPRKFCSQACARAGHAAERKQCIQCDGEIPVERRQCVTCSDDCARARMQAAHDAAKRPASKPCEACGVEMHGAPSTLGRTCGPSCRSSLAARERHRRPCTVCGKPVEVKTRTTCSDTCIKAAASRRTALLAKASEAKRAKRRKAKAASYRGKDRAEVVARLTREQRGRCKVCGREGTERGDGKRGLVLDHCHVTGVARALLCGPCNAALGLLGESAERIAALHRYALSWAQAALLPVAKVG